MEKIKNKKILKRSFKGTVVSDKMDKTVVVAVMTVKIYPKYKKRYQSINRFKAHDEKNVYKISDKVLIEETRPISKDKRWKVVKKI